MIASEEAALRSELIRAYVRIEELEATLASARWVADYWRVAYLALPGNERIGAHGHCCVLSALEGERDPVELGIEPERWDEFRAAVNDTPRTRWVYDSRENAK